MIAYLDRRFGIPERIKAPRTQRLIWVGMSAVFGVGFVAGLYWLFLQQHYPFMPGSGSLKLWWDNGMGIIHSGRWPTLRHGVRDLGEPAAWTIFAALLLLKAKDHPRILPTWLLVAWSAVLGVGTVAAAVGLTWLINFTAFRKVPDPYLWKQLAAGVLLGFALKRAWSPVTGTIRYHVITKTHGIPLWVRFPLLSPAWRQEWIDTHAQTLIPQQGASVAVKQGNAEWKAVVLVTLGILAFLFIAVVGILAKYPIAHGYSIPGMTSG